MPRKPSDDAGGKPRPSRIPPPKSGRFHGAKTHENGFDKVTSGDGDNSANNSPNRTESRRYETFVMTGDMIIQTTSPHHKPGDTSPQKEKRLNDVKGSPVPAKKECRSNIAKKASPSPKGSPKTQPKSRIPTSAAAAATPESPKLSGRRDSNKTPPSPAKQPPPPQQQQQQPQQVQSRLPRPQTPKGSPKSSPKKVQKHSTSSSASTDTSSTSTSSVTTDNVQFSAIKQDGDHISVDIINANMRNGHHTRPETRPNLELLGFPRYPDVPVELDIPPDDISSEDERYKNEDLLDMDDLPPPPEEFFQAELAMLMQNQEPLPAPLTPDVAEPSMPSLLPRVNGNSLCNDLPSLSPVREAQEPAFEFTAEDKTPSDLLTKPQTPGHIRCASAGDGGAMDFDNHSTCSDSRLEQSEYRNSPARTIVVSKSAEKIAQNRSAAATSNSGLPMSSVVRSSKSHENYLESNEGVTLIDIDIEENMASSVDALHYEKSCTSLDSLGYVQFSPDQVRSLDSSPDKKDRPTGQRVFMPTFINLEEARSISKVKEGGKFRDFSAKPKDETAPSSSQSQTSSSSPASPAKHQSSLSSASSSSSSPAKKTQSSPSRNPSSPSKSTSSSASSPSKTPSKQNKPSDDRPKNPGSPGRPSGIPVSKDRKPPRPPIRTTASQRSPDEDANNSAVPPPESPIIESPVHNASSHVVDTDLPTDEEAPIATSSTPPSPVPDLEVPESLEPHPLAASGHGALGEEGVTAAGEVYHQPVKDIDRPSAQRLAKRLYHLDGFKKTDVTRHLSKKNEFSYLVGEEFLKFFSFSGETLDSALRNFLKNLTLVGETQERERILAHFSRRYLETNPDSYNSEDSCHTLVCALMLLNTDLHGQNIGRKMSANEFIENLADLNDGDNFPREVLKNLYHSIRTEPLECHFEDSDSESGASSSRAQDPRYLAGHNPFLDVPDPNKATEFKRGYVMRKCCVDADGHKTPVGKRGWRMFYASLRDMVLYLYKDDHAFKKNTMVANSANAIRIHHALAFRATDYKKKQHVFRLQTVDWAQYLFQTSNSKECQEWIDKLNFVAASLSAPPLAGAVGSQRKFQRPLMPVSYTRLNLREQAMHHEQKVLELDQEIHEHRNYPPERGSKARFIQDYVDKEQYLTFELKRFKVYSAMLQMKLATYPELEPSLVEVAIGEVDEPPNSLPGSPEIQRPPPGVPVPTPAPAAAVGNPAPAAAIGNPVVRPSKPVQRSQSDRPPSQHAIAKTTRAPVAVVNRAPVAASNVRSPANQHPASPVRSYKHRYSTPVATNAAYETQV